MEAEGGLLVMIDCQGEEGVGGWTPCVMDAEQVYVPLVGVTGQGTTRNKLRVVRQQRSGGCRS